MVNLTTLLSGAMGAAIVCGIFGLINRLLDRKAAKKDRAEEKQDKTAEEISNLTHGTRMLLYIEIKDRARKYIQDEAITPEDLEDILAMHAIYHDELGGNGFLDSVIKQVKALHIQN